MELLVLVMASTFSRRMVLDRESNGISDVSASYVTLAVRNVTVEAVVCGQSQLKMTET